MGAVIRVSLTIYPKYWFTFTSYQPASIAQSLACLTADPCGLKFESQLGLITFVKIVHRIIATVASWISDWHSHSYFRFRGHSVATVCFKSNRPTIWEEKSKLGFQEGGLGSHFGFPIGMTLAIFHLQVNLVLHCKFPPCGLRDVQNRFSRWRLWRRTSWISDRNDFSSFRSRRCSVSTEPVSAQIDQKSGKGCRKLIFKMVAWIFGRLSFSYFVSTRRSDASHQVSVQLDHSL